MPTEETAVNKIYLLILDIAVKNKNPKLWPEITHRIKEDLQISAHRLTKILENKNQPTPDEAINITTILNEYIPEESDKLSMEDLFEKAKAA